MARDRKRDDSLRIYKEHNKKSAERAKTEMTPNGSRITNKELWDEIATIKVMIADIAGDIKVRKEHDVHVDRLLERHDTKIDDLEISDKKWSGIAMIVAAFFAAIGQIIAYFLTN